MEWLNFGTDRPPQIDEALELIKKSNIEKLFTTSLNDYDGSSLWNLCNHKVSEIHDYEKDPYPDADVYFALTEYVRRTLKENGVEVEEVKIPKKYLST